MLETADVVLQRQLIGAARMQPTGPNSERLRRFRSEDFDVEEEEEEEEWVSFLISIHVIVMAREPLLKKWSFYAGEDVGRSRYGNGLSSSWYISPSTITREKQVRVSLSSFDK
jgi:hypothetical protein